MIITKDIADSEIPSITKETFNLLKAQFGYNARIGDIINILEKATGCNFDVDFKSAWDPIVFSRLLDYQSLYITTGLDLGELKDYIYSKFELSRSLTRLLDKNNIEDRLWAVMMSISLPSHNYFNLSDDRS